MQIEPEEKAGPMPEGTIWVEVDGSIKSAKNKAESILKTLKN